MGKKHLEGFTLIELLVLMMVLAITVGLGVPALNDLVAGSRMTAAANDLVNSLHTARNAALTRNGSVTLCASSDWDSVQPNCSGGASLLAGWIVFADDNANGVVDGTDVVLLTHGSLGDSIRLQAGSGPDRAPPQYLSFRADGMVQALAGLPGPVRNIQLCDRRGNRDMGGGLAAGRWLAISNAGRPTLTDQVLRLQGADNPLGGC